MASRVGAIPEAVRHDETGLLVAPNDAAAFADAVVRLLGDDPLRQRLGQQAKLRYDTVSSPLRIGDAVRRKEISSGMVCRAHSFFLVGTRIIRIPSMTSSASSRWQQLRHQ